MLTVALTARSCGRFVFIACEIHTNEDSLQQKTLRFMKKGIDLADGILKNRAESMKNSAESKAARKLKIKSISGPQKLIEAAEKKASNEGRSFSSYVMFLMKRDVARAAR